MAIIEYEVQENDDKNQWEPIRASRPEPTDLRFNFPDIPLPDPATISHLTFTILDLHLTPSDTALLDALQTLLDSGYSVNFRPTREDKQVVMSIGSWYGKRPLALIADERDVRDLLEQAAEVVGKWLGKAGQNEGGVDERGLTLDGKPPHTRSCSCPYSHPDAT